MKPIAAFLDCEFTDLQAPQLLALGLVTATGQQFYAELDLSQGEGAQRAAGAATFTIDTVLPQFGLMPEQVSSERELGKRLMDWLLTLGAPLQVAYDYHADFDLMEAALKAAGAWEHVGELLQPAHVGYLWGAEEATRAAEQSWDASFAKLGVKRHHALADAIALKAAYIAVHY